MNCSDLFYADTNTENTLHQRTQLSEVILSKGIAKKNELIEFLRQELKEVDWPLESPDNQYHLNK
ncbi:hypothetical protein J4U97_09950 [Escherichia coli]